MPSKTKTNLKIGLGLSVLLLIISSTVSFISINTLLRSSARVRNSNHVILHAKDVLFSLKDAETRQRGFLLANDATFLDSFKSACVQAKESMATLRQLTIADPAQQENIRLLQNYLDRRIDRLQLLLEKKRNVNAINPEDMQEGKMYMDSTRSLVSSIVRKEQYNLSRHSDVQQKFAIITPVVIVVTALLSIVLAIVLYTRIIRDIRKRMELQDILLYKDVEMNERIEVIKQIAEKIAHGEYHTRVDDAQKDSLGSLAVSLNKMATSLDFSFGKLSDNEWLQSGLATLNEKMVEAKDLQYLTSHIIQFLCSYTGSHVGALYLADNDVLVLSAGFALMNTGKKTIAPGEGIAGQCFLSRTKIILDNVDPDYITISHATGSIKAKYIIACPIFSDNNCIGVIEMATTREYTERDLSFIKLATRNIGKAIHTAQNHKKLQELLEEVQAQSEELQAQHSELENVNAELEAHTHKLEASEESLKLQQEELRQNNIELEERNRIISHQNIEIQRKAQELEQSTKYKSEFMANMSHELRTPLNSILLLSRYLSDNGENNLSEDQLESARVIYNSGNSLLKLIDELLDLSKIEAGKMELDYTTVYLPDLLSDIQAMFLPVAKEKGIHFSIQNMPGNITTIETDRMKLEQILKNLISNALKFTQSGEVILSVMESGIPKFIQFIVKDTGIGIAPEKQKLIFEAFTQADGSTRRKYGGTGLGLAISRQLTKLLGGDISLNSEPGVGSTFILTVPIEKKTVSPTQATFPINEIPVSNNEEQSLKTRYRTDVIPEDIEDDRNHLEEGDKVVLIIEDDTSFANVLLQFSRKQNYKGLVAVRGDQGIEMARKYKPVAILLDIKLPVMDGWEVMDVLKSDPVTRPIPVHIMSSMEAQKESRINGAVDFFNKPLALEHMQQMFKKLEDVLSKTPKKALIIEENAKHAKALAYFLRSYNVTSLVEHNIEASIKSLKKKDVDCVILDMSNPDTNACHTLEKIKANPGMEHMPVIVFTGKNLSEAEEAQIKQYAASIIIKTAHSYQSVLNEVALFLHLVEENQHISSANRYNIQFPALEILAGKTVLIADDDVRNIFSLTKSLEKHKINVITATDGIEALQQLEQHPETDIILMDMMMPQMDGYTTCEKIRKDYRFKGIPIIAVTAKAMMRDREKCIAAGASDYISKPVDIDQLISLLKVWLYDKQSTG